MPQTSLIKDFQAYGCNIIGVDCNHLSVGFKFCDDFYTIPKATDKDFIRELLCICKLEQPDAIIISPDEEIIEISKQRRKFESLKVKLLIPSQETIETCNDKYLTYGFFTAHSIPTPETTLYMPYFSFPMIVKPRNGRGGQGVFKVHGLQELRNKKTTNNIVQEFVEGKEYTIDVLSDWNSNPISVVIRERMEVESGICTKGKVIHDKEITEHCKQIVKNLGLIGMSCIQCIRGKEGLKFIEINLRFGGGSVLSRRADPTIIDNYLRLIEGEETVKVEEPKLLTMLRYYSEVII